MCIRDREQAEYDKIQAEKALAEEDEVQSQQPDTNLDDLQEDVPEQPAPTIRAVSYTHLDVYKRQASSRASKNCLKAKSICVICPSCPDFTAIR